MSLRENIAEVKRLENEIREHPMCSRFVVTGVSATTYYPEGACLDGARVSLSKGKAVGLRLLLAAMERHWKDSGV